ncbi:MAG: hypothetical protein Q8Q04_01735 [archaeon]|nr:hypothetical protein [archaeon]
MNKAHLLSIGYYLNKRVCVVEGDSFKVGDSLKNGEKIISKSLNKMLVIGKENNGYKDYPVKTVYKRENDYWNPWIQKSISNENYEKIMEELKN